MRCHVICLGNRWHGDDGLGLHVFDRLSASGALPPDVRLFEGGVAGLNVLPLLEGCAKAVLVDAIECPAPPGTVLRLTPEDCAEPGPEVSVHAMGVNHLVACIPVLLPPEARPEVVIAGIAVEGIRSFDDRLSPQVDAALDDLMALVSRECAP